VAVPDTRFDAVAVIVAVPAPTPVAIPLVASIVATLGSLVDQANVVDTGLFDASNAVAVKACVAPASIEAVLGETVTVAG
jgi:hypothetical protein